MLGFYATCIEPAGVLSVVKSHAHQRDFVAHCLTSHRCLFPKYEVRIPQDHTPLDT